MKNLALWSILTSFLLSGLALAGLPSKVEIKNDNTTDQKVIEKARRRLYLGGSDEQDLEVQKEVLRPTRKIGPNSNEGVAPAEEEF